MRTASLIAAADLPGGQAPGDPASCGDQNRWIAAQLLERFVAAKPKEPDGFIPDDGMQGGEDIPRPRGLYTEGLIGGT